MITLLTGENSFELTRALDKYESAFVGVAEKFDGTDLELSQLPDLLLGGTLFADKRMIIIKNLSENKPLWEVLPEWLGRVSDDTHVVFVEPKPDKRTKTYKDLKKYANVSEFGEWSDRDVALAERWVVAEAEGLGFSLDKKCVQLIVDRVGLDQWQLYHALQKLSVLDVVTSEIIEDIIDAAPSENVFNLFDAALRGDGQKVVRMLGALQQVQDPYMTFGLLSSQCFQLAALSVAEKSVNDTARDIGAHPYALGKLAPHAKKIGPSGVRKVTKYFADADTAMKSSSVDPWLLIEEVLIKVATL